MEGDGEMEDGRVTKVLLVDDDQNLPDYYKMLFEKRKDLGVEIDSCFDGNELTEKLKTGHYDIIILDQRLSDGERGIDLIPTIKAFSSETRIILNSAYGNEDLAVESLRRGIDDYVCGNKENDEMLIECVIRIRSGINAEERIKEMISKKREAVLDIKACCDEKMSKILGRMKKVNQAISSE